MSRRLISTRVALHRLRPTTPADRRSLLKLAVILILILGVVQGLLFLKRQDLEIRERTWQSATAVILDTRPTLAMRVDTGRGGAMAYRVEVLVRYQSGPTTQQQWVTISGLPESLAEAQFKSFLLKGKTCTVHWRPADPQHLIAEIS